MRFRYFTPRTPSHGHRHVFVLPGYVEDPSTVAAIAEAEAWCTTHIGPRSGFLDEDLWHPSARQIYIREDHDALAFKMRFG